MYIWSVLWIMSTYYKLICNYKRKNQVVLYTICHFQSTARYVKFHSASSNDYKEIHNITLFHSNSIDIN